MRRRRFTSLPVDGTRRFGDIGEGFGALEEECRVENMPGRAEAADEERGMRAGGLTVDAMTCGVREKALVPFVASVYSLLDTLVAEKAWDLRLSRSLSQGCVCTFQRGKTFYRMS